ncbi:MAG TPA: helix-turn-helix domain-containing protein [Paracoccus sp. (in: a-proteobacteria)]|uniref:helix-turn-helix transcriptional regulator n=1 Tax=Paracoccus sp. TaxID=267 RepID=UPI002C0AC448|nr:helix-turn-helix domain-containing protein [Paracoccus sp. (in: a-proteobacteria)]HWL56316.1 helix-turn-helix domain-containing protein [Paracoccus sp. (in: a-proteobacteria)]
MTQVTDYVTTPELAARLGVSRATLGRAAKKGTLPLPVRLSPGGPLLWPIAEVEAFLKRTRNTTNAPISPAKPD